LSNDALNVAISMSLLDALINGDYSSLIIELGIFARTLRKRSFG
jgi:hypothetical protein